MRFLLAWRLVKSPLSRAFSVKVIVSTESVALPVEMRSKNAIISPDAGASGKIPSLDPSRSCSKCDASCTCASSRRAPKRSKNLSRDGQPGGRKTAGNFGRGNAPVGVREIAAGQSPRLFPRSLHDDVLVDKLGDDLIHFRCEWREQSVSVGLVVPLLGRSENRLHLPVVSFLVGAKELSS